MEAVVEEADRLVMGEEEEAVVVVLDEEDEDDQITTATTIIIILAGTMVRIRTHSIAIINLSSSNRHLRNSNSKVNRAMLLRTSLIDGRE